MTAADRTTEALLARRALAEKATPGEWITTGLNAVHGGYRNRLIYSDENPHILIASMGSTDKNPKCVEDSAHIAANSPDVTMADIDEILRLRAEAARLEREAYLLAEQIAEVADCPPDYEHHISAGATLRCDKKCKECWRNWARLAIDTEDASEEDDEN